MEKIVVWGAGRLAKRFLDLYGEQYKILNFIDGLAVKTDPKSMIKGINILAKEDYFNSSLSEYPLYIVSAFYTEIYADLLLQGISEEFKKRLNVVLLAYNTGDRDDLLLKIYPAKEFNPPLERYVEWLPEFNGFRQQLIDNKVPTFYEEPARFSLLRQALAQATVEGLSMEFGTWKGESIRFMASLSPRQFWGFDSFEGLPEYWVTHYDKGTFTLNGELPPVPNHVTLVKGWFNETLPSFLATHQAPIRFLHMDADLYSSTAYVLSTLHERIIPGTIIVFDEFNYIQDPTCAERRAFLEFISQYNKKFEYIGQSPASVGVKIIA